MRRGVVVVSEAVYNWAMPMVDPCPLSLPFYWIALAAGSLAEWLEPIPPRQ